MHYLTVSFSYKNSDVEVREALNLSNEEQFLPFARYIYEHKDVAEVIINSTCNRIELFAYVYDISAVKAFVFDALSSRSALDIGALKEHADIYTDDGAIYHLFSVASSLDSLVVGETQIVGQLRDAYRLAYDNNLCAANLSKAMHFAFKCAAQVREATSISSKPVSIASIAVTMAKDLMGTFINKKALVIGAGEMSRIAVQYLVAQGCDVTLINRSIHKAQAIAQEVGQSVEVVPFERLGELVNTHELLITSTGALKPIVTASMIQDVPFERYFFDLAVPKDIDIRKDESIELIRVDDLEAIARKNRTFRQEEAKRSFAIVSEHTQEFYAWMRQKSVEPFIKMMYQKAHHAAQEEAKRASKKYLPKEYEMHIQKVALQAQKRFLHDITARIRAVAHSKESDTVINALQHILGIPQDDETLKD